MALVVKDRVKESTTTTGTADFILGGASSGFQTFAVIGNGNSTYYAIADQATGDWEVGIGTYSTTGPTLTRDTILESSNSGSKVVFAAGAKEVFCTYPAERSVYLDTAGSAVTVLDIGTLGTSTANITTANITAGTVSTTPSSGNDIANKTYVDTIASSGITYHTPVKYEVPNTTGNLNATYNQPGGPGVGVGATLTNAGTLAAFAPDGPTASPGDRILVYNQTNAFENGVYTVTTVGNGSTAWVLTRATDADTYAVKSPTALGNGDAFFITSGNTGAGETYVCNTVGTITFGTTAITFAQISDATLYTAGTGLTLTGTEFSITNTGTAGTYGSASNVPVFVTNAQGQVTSVTNTAISISAGSVSGLAASATTDTTNAANITAGTLNSARLTGSYTGITGVGTIAAGTWNGSVIGATYGGTGQSAYTVGDLLYADTTTSLARLASPLPYQTLLSNGIGTAPSWGYVSLSASVTGVLAPVNGGTGLGAFTSNGVLYASATTTLATSANLTFNGTDLTVSGIVNATTADLTNLEVTNIKAKDGTAALTIADSTGNVSISSQLSVDNLTLAGNTLSSTDANGNINIVPNGTGGVYTDNTNGASLFVRNTTASTSGSSLISFQNRDGASAFRTVARASGVTTSNGGNGDFLVETAYSGVLYKGLLVDSLSDVYFYNSSGARDLRWDSVNQRLGVNNIAPTANLDVTGTANVSGALSAGSLAGSIATGSGASGTWSINISGNAATATTAANVNNGTLTLAVAGTGLSGSATFTANQAGNSTFTVTSNATNANTASTIVARDASGNFSAGTITASLSGNATSATTATTATTATNQSGGTVNATTGAFSGNLVSSNGYSNDATGALRIFAPGGASYATGASSVTGAIKIRIPAAALGSNTMMSFKVKIYQYSTGLSGELQISGYNYSDASATWYNVSATNLSQSLGDLTVRFGKDGTSQCVYIGDLASTWYYPQVVVTDFFGGYSQYTTAMWASGWSVSFEASAFAGVTNTITANRTLSSGNYNSYAPTLTGGGASGTWSINVTGSAGSATTATTANALNTGNSYTGTAFTASSTDGYFYANRAAIANQAGIQFRTAGNTNWYNFLDNNSNTLAWYQTNTNTQVMTLTQAGVLNVVGNITQGGSQVLTAGNYNSYAPTLTGGGASGTWGINISGNAVTATTASNSNLLNNLSSTQLFNNMGQNHNTYTDANSFTNFGTQFLQGTTNGPGAGGSQWYMLGMGLGNDYAYSSYAMQVAIPRTPLGGDPYISVRFREGGTWNSWAKIWAGYADSAGSATTADQIDSWPFRNTGSNSATAADSLDSNGITYVAYNISLFGQTDGALYSQAYSSSWQHQIFGDYRTGQIAIRGKNNGTWQSWRAVLDATNYTSYAPSLTGSGASGTWGINISGNAATATNVAGLVQNSFSTYGNTATTTVKNSYYGLLLGNSTSGLNFMATGDGYGGIYRESSGTWAQYYNPAINCTGFGSSATTAGYVVQATGSLYVTSAILAGGNVTAYSDERLKTNWRDLPQDFVAQLAKVKVGVYDRTDEKDLTQVGVSAQSLQTIMPEAVTVGPDDMLSVSYGNAALAAAVKLAERVVMLEEKLAKLMEGGK